METEELHEALMEFIAEQINMNSILIKMIRALEEKVKELETYTNINRKLN
jgi:molybdopterin-guanine dinucleotide biosynthesis protein A